MHYPAVVVVAAPDGLVLPPFGRTLRQAAIAEAEFLLAVPILTPCAVRQAWNFANAGLFELAPAPPGRAPPRPKPPAGRRLAQAVKALRRRGRGWPGASARSWLAAATAAEAAALRQGGSVLDEIELTRIEFSLLQLLLTQPNKVLSRSVIFGQVWGNDIGFASNSLEVYVGSLRRKTEEGGGSRLIQTVRGIGYVLRETGR